MNLVERVHTKDPMREFSFRRTLTLTLSHPMGEGTNSALTDCSMASVANDALLDVREDRSRLLPTTRIKIFERARMLSLSHRMGEGRGEGFPRIVSRVEPMNCRSRREEADSSSPNNQLESPHVDTYSSLQL